MVHSAWVDEESATVAAAAEEQAASLSEVTGSATWLSRRAGDLRRALSAFTVDQAAGEADDVDVRPEQRSTAATDGGAVEDGVGTDGVT